MADNFGLRIGVEGEREFKKSLADINQSFKVLGSEMKLVSSQFDKNDNSVQALSARNTVLNKEIDAQRQKVETLRSALQNAAESFGENDRRTQNWQIQLNNAEAALNGMERELSQNEQAIEALNNQEEQTVDATERLTQEISRQEEELAGLKRAYSNAVLEYGKGSDEAKELEERISRLSKELEENCDTLREADDAMEDASDGADKLGTGLSAATVAMGDLISSGIQAALDGIKELGSAIWNLDEATEEYRVAQGKLTTAFEAAGYSGEAAQESYTEFYKILGDTDTATEASQLLAQLAENEQDITKWTNIAAGVCGTFGDALPIEGLIESANETAKVGQVTGSLADALNWVGISEDAFNEKLDACSDESERNRLIMETLSGTYDEASQAFYRNNEALVASREGQARMDETLAGLGETISNVKNNLRAEFLPAIADVVSAFTDMVNGVEGADTAFAEAITGLVNTAAIMLPQFVSTGTQMLASLLSGIIQSLPAIVEAAVQIVSTLATGIRESLPTLVPAIVQAVTTIVQTLADNLPTILDAALQLILGLAQGLLDAIPVLIEALPQIIASIVDFLIGAIPQIIDAGIQLLTSLVTALPEIITAVVAAIPQIINGIITAVIGSIPQLIEAGVKLLVALIQNLPTIITTIIGAIPQIITSVVDALIGSIPQLIEAGVTLFIALIENLPTIIIEIVKAIPQIIKGIVDAFGSYFGKMAEVGGNLLKGLWQGISDAGAWLRDKISGFFWAVVPEDGKLASPNRAYIRFRVTFTTTDTSKTPKLVDIRLYDIPNSPYKKIGYARPVVLDRNGAWEAVLENAYDIILTGEVNGEDTLSFKIPYRDSKRAFIDSEKKIQIVNDIYKVRTVKDSKGENSESVTEVYAEAEFYDLAFSVRKDEAAFESERADGAMAYALKDTEWSVGTVTVRAERSWVSRETNALAILRNIADLYGGDLVFDCPNRLVHLLTTSGKDSGALFAYKKNMKSIERTVDTRGLITRLYATGADGMTFARINHGKPYLEDFTYTSDVRVSSLDCSSFSNPYQMMEYTAMRLAQYSKPSVSYVLNAMDLSVLTGYEHEAWDLGDYVRVEDKELGLSVTTRIVRREYNLQEPWNTVLELSTTLKNLGTSANQWDNAADAGGGFGSDMSEMVPFNQLRNSRADDGLAYWTSSGFEAVGGIGVSGTASFCAEGVAGETLSLSQTVYPSSRSVYTLSAQIASEDLTKLSEDSQVGIEVIFEYEDGTTDSRFIDLY